MKKNIFLKSVCSLSLAITPLYGMAAGTAGVDSTTAKPVSTQPNVNQSSNNASGSNSSGQAMSYIASAMEFAVAAQNWSACGPHNPGACATAALFTVMGIQSMKQGGEHGNKAGQAAYTAGLTDAYGSGAYDSTTTDGGNSQVSKIGDSYLKKAEAGLSSLQKQGYVDANASKVTAPDGTSYKVSDMTTPAAMEAAGMPKGAIDAAMSTYAQIEKKAMDKLKIGAQTTANGYEEGGGGGSSLSGPDPGAVSMAAGAGSSGSGGTGNGLSRDPSSLAAGMSKNYNGEPIGVAADSIFLMMARRYKVKESQDSFFDKNDLNLKK